MGNRKARGVIHDFGETLGMWTLYGTYVEACSLISGFDAATDGELLADFRPWLLKRTGNPRQNLAWPSLIFEDVFPEELPGGRDYRAMSAEQNAVATKALFALLDEFLASNG
jgi:hypothetical protein